jgi:replication factor C subunit 2/4
MTENNYDSVPWVEKYRPKKMEEMIQSQNLLDLFQNIIETQDMTHTLFYGPPGTGKTSAILAISREIFKEYFPMRVIEFNASDDRGINAVREKITNEAKKKVTETVSADGTKIPPYKIIILDEADSMTDEAQDALRVIIEQYSTVTRFCFICNYISKITDAIKSRCSPVYFKKLSYQCMTSKLEDITTKESMNLTNDNINTIIEVSNGDMRKAIMLLQNLKYLYNFKMFMNKSLSDIPVSKLKYIPILNTTVNENSEITEADIYDIAASIPLEKAHKIINKALSCRSIIEISILSKEIIAKGYPIDNVLTQLNKAVLNTKKLNDFQKANVIYYSGKIFLKMKECANEYIQLLDYMSSINGIKNGNKAYEFQYLTN